MYLIRFHQRALHVSLPRLLRDRRKNPGIAYQVKEDLLDPEYAEQDDPGSLDADFTALHKTHREHEADMQRQREKIKRHMVKHKYFREPHLPNLLTYAEKEQMRYLNARDPEEWTPDRLAECFPTTPAIVCKLLAGKWRPRTRDRIKKHDEVVLANWEKLRNGRGELQLPPALHEHLQKFANRRPEDLQALSAEEWSSTQTQLPKPHKTEFLSIITSCDKYADLNAADKNQITANKQQHLAPPRAGNADTIKPDAESDTYLLDKVKDKRKMRLQELKQLKLSPEELALSNSMHSVDLEYRAATTLPNPSGTGILPKAQHATSSPLSVYAKKFESAEIVITAEDQRRFEMTRAKDRIHIPRKVWREGATYRVEDCYYDHDGELLYRVPGMTGNS